MRQAVMTSPGVIEHGEIPEPKPGPGEVLLRITRIGVCGSDIHVNHGKHPFTPYPVVQGHEFAAIIEGVGEGVDKSLVGKNATATPQVVCGECKPCKRGDYHICDDLKVEGFQAPGVAQDLFVTPFEKVVPLPDDFTPEKGALVEPVSVAVHCSARAGDVEGKNVVVTGAGPIGNLVAQMCRCRGGNVLITDVSDFRLDKAKDCKIPHVSNAKSESLADASKRVFGDDGFDVALECSGVEAALTDAISAVNKGGTIVAIAVYDDNPRVNMSFVQDRELKIIGSLMYQYADYVEAAERIESGEIVTEPLDTGHFPFEQYKEAYKFIDDQGGNTLKVFVDLQ